MTGLTSVALSTTTNIKHIKDNIYEAEAKGNYYRLVTLKMLHPNNKEFCSLILRELFINLKDVCVNVM